MDKGLDLYHLSSIRTPGFLHGRHSEKFSFLKMKSDSLMASTVYSSTMTAPKVLSDSSTKDDGKNDSKSDQPAVETLQIATEMEKKATSKKFKTKRKVRKEKFPRPASNEPEKLDSDNMELTNENNRLKEELKKNKQSILKLQEDLRIARSLVEKRTTSDELDEISEKYKEAAYALSQFIADRTGHTQSEVLGKFGLQD